MLRVCSGWARGGGDSIVKHVGEKGLQPAKPAVYLKGGVTLQKGEVCVLAGNNV